MYTPLTARVEIVVTEANAWKTFTASNEVDLPASSVSGLLLEFENSYGGTLWRKCAARMYGSNDSYVARIAPVGGIAWPVGISDGKFQINISDLTYIKVYAVGYFTASDHFFSEPIDVSPSAATTWTETDLSPYVPAGVGVIIRVPATADNYFGARAADSTDAITYRTGFGMFIFSKMNESLAVDLYAGILTPGMQLIGYVVYGSAVLDTNLTDVDGTTSDVYADFAALGSGDAGAGIYNVVTYTPATSYVGATKFDIRPNGSTTETQLVRAGLMISACDSGGVCEGLGHSGVTVKIYQVGYFTKNVAALIRYGCMAGDYWVG